MLSRKLYCSSAHAEKTHPYHLVDPSPWPAMMAVAVLVMVVGLATSFHQYPNAGIVLAFGFCFVLYGMFLWWRDVLRESNADYHTPRVQTGLHLGMMIFIVTEAMFFVGLIWAFVHAALMPTVQIGQNWPPEGIIPVEWYGRPALNTAILAASYFSANIAKYAMEINNRKLCQTQLLITVFLGFLFLYYQWEEYTSAPFTFSDSVFGCNFYLATGFHGFHVLLGALFLSACLLFLHETTPEHSVGLHLAVLYWHFVDIVWIGIYAIIYLWGSQLPPRAVYFCSDPGCVYATILQETKMELFKTDPSFFQS